MSPISCCMGLLAAAHAPLDDRRIRRKALHQGWRGVRGVNVSISTEAHRVGTRAAGCMPCQQALLRYRLSFPEFPGSVIRTVCGVPTARFFRIEVGDPSSESDRLGLKPSIDIKIDAAADDRRNRTADD